MTETEKTELMEIVEQLKAINNKLDSIIGKDKTDSQELKNRGILNGLLHICTQPNFDDKQYTDALRQISELPFGLSAKQISWVLMYTPRHPECGEVIQKFIIRQFEKQKDTTEYIDSIAEILRTKYANDNNNGFIEKMIARLKEI